MLSKFYVELHEWCSTGFGRNDYFSRFHGVCTNLMMWANKNGYTHLQLADMNTELTTSFVNAELDEAHPFNNGIATEYRYERANGILYKNSKRLEWIKKHATSV